MNQVDILIADDEPHIVRALGFIFQKEGLRIETAMDGEEACAKYRLFRPRIVFLDIAMPKKDGVTVCREIKAEPSGRRTHVVMLTCKGQDIDRTHCLDAGANVFISKPFSPKEVLELVRTLLRE